MPLTTLPIGAEHLDPAAIRRRCWKAVKLGQLDGWEALSIVIEHQLAWQRRGTRTEQAA